MDFKKIFTSKTVIAIVFVVITVLSVLGFSAICKRGGSYMFRDRRGEVKENFQNGEKVFDLSENENSKQITSSLIFKGDSVDNTYSIHDEQHKIEIRENEIKVDGFNIFKTDKILKRVYLIDDIFMADVIGADDIKLNLIFFDTNGNVIKKIDDISNYSIDGTKIYYTIDKYISSDSDIIYEMHSVEDYSFEYLGNYNFSEESHSTVHQDIINGDAVLYKKGNLQIEYIEEVDKSDSQIYFLTESFIRINGNDIKVAPVLIEIRKLSDNYLMIESCYQDGYSHATYIVDYNGNLVTNFNEIVGEKQFTSHALISLSDRTYSDGYFYIYTVDYDSYEKYGQYFNGICEGYDERDVLSRGYKFKYLGNGKVDDGKIINEVTVKDYLDKYSGMCE